MPIEQILTEIEKQRAVISQANTKIKELTEEIASIPVKDWDWISVKVACKMLDISMSVIYHKINIGQLDCKYIGAKKFVSRKQLEKLNDTREEIS